MVAGGVRVKLSWMFSLGVYCRTLSSNLALPCGTQSVIGDTGGSSQSPVITPSATYLEDR